MLKFSIILMRTDSFCVQRIAMPQKQSLKDNVQKLKRFFFFQVKQLKFRKVAGLQSQTLL